MSRSLAQWWLRAQNQFDQLRWLVNTNLPTAPPETRHPIRADALEPRMLFSATPIDPALLLPPESGVLASSDEPMAIQTDQGMTSGETATSEETSNGNETAKTLVFIDASVNDVERLVRDLRDVPETDVFVLDADRDGIEQISEILNRCDPVDSIHIVSHAEQETIRLGKSGLNRQSLAGYAGQIASWGSALREDADVLFYGCDLAASEGGRELLESIAALSGADVAASIDDTGHDRFGGNWDLEFQIGDVNHDTVFSNALQASWDAKLSVITVSTTSDSIDGNDGLISLREAIKQARDGDTIVLPAGHYELSRFGFGSNAGDLDLRHDVHLVGAGAQWTRISGHDATRVFDIRNHADVQIRSLTIENGSALQGGAIRVRDEASLHLEQVVIRDSTALFNGGGIYNEGTLSLVDSSVAENQSGFAGGGIYSTHSLNVLRTSIESNTSTLTGGGIHVQSGDVELAAVTLSGNRTSGHGGGLYNRGTAEIVHATIARNVAASGGGVYGRDGEVQLQFTLLAENTATSGSDFWGSGFVSNGFNLIGDSDGLTALASSDLRDVAANLMPLADNGGFGRTHALAPTSAAIDTAPTSTHSLDGRGLRRAVDGNSDGSSVADIGAFEAPTPTQGIVTVTTADDHVDTAAITIADLVLNPGTDGKISLREAMRAVNQTANDGEPDQIRFAIDGEGIHEIRLTESLVFTEAVSIDGFTQPGSTESTPTIVIRGAHFAGGSQDLIHLDSGNSTVRGLSLVNSDGAAIRIGAHDGNVVVGNWIGIRPDGSVDENALGVVVSGSTNTTIGGQTANERNLLTGNSLAAVWITSSARQTTIQGNFFGTDSSGSNVVDSGNIGISISDGSSQTLIGGDESGQGNLIAGFDWGIAVSSSAGTDTTLYGNTLGTDLLRTANLGNDIAVWTARGGITVGGIQAGQANTIAYSETAAIEFFGNQSSPNRLGATIRGNSLFANALGIDLGSDGITPNDLGVPNDQDDGPNGLQNYPRLTSARVTSGQLVIEGVFEGAAVSGTTIDFYYTHSDNRQGRTYLGSATLDPSLSDEHAFRFDAGSVQVVAGHFITATATDFDGSTSEFSPGVIIEIENSPPTDITLSRSAIDEGTDTTGGYLIGALESTDADIADGAQFEIVGGIDAALFRIGGQQNEELLLDHGVLDYESKSQYQLDVKVTDDAGATFTKTLVIVVNDLPDGFITVTTTSDRNDTGLTTFDVTTLLGNRGLDGEISLREALIAANHTAGVETIRFDIDGDGPHIIQLTGQLPRIEDTVTIDGTATQNGSGQPMIFLDGQYQTIDGLWFSAGSDGSHLSGIGLMRFGSNGIVIQSSNNTLSGNWIGVSPDQSSTQQISGTGIKLVAGADNNSVTGNTLGNSRLGIHLLDASGNTFTGNAIGTDFPGDQVFSIGQTGIRIEGDSDNNRIGLSGEGNTLANIAGDGISILGESTGNTVRYNAITKIGDLPLDLDDNGVDSIDPLDSDVGGNLLQNRPILTAATLSSQNTLAVHLSLTTAADQSFRIDFYEASRELTSLGEPIRYVGYSQVTTPATGQLQVLASGSVSGIVSGDWIVATVTDSAGNTSEFSFPTIVLVTNAAPVIADLESSPLTFTENSAPLAISHSLTISDGDSQTLQSATLVLADYVPDEDSLRFQDTLNITGEWNATSGILTLRGSATVAEYQQALRSVEYLNTSENPRTLTRTLQISVSDGQNSSAVSSRQIDVVSHDDPTTGTIILPMAVREDQTLSADTTSVTDLDGIRSISFQWLSDGEVIQGATAQDFTPDQSHVGNQLSVVVTVTDENGNVVRLLSNQTDNVRNVDDPLTGRPEIIGTPREDRTLSVSLSQISDDDGLNAPDPQYQWFRNGVAIQGATDANWTLGDADVNANISVAVTLTDDFNVSTTVYSDVVGPIENVNDAPSGLPTVSGQPLEGEWLSANVASLVDNDGLPNDLQFQWLRDGSEIQNANASTYHISENDIAATLSVRVSYLDLNGTHESVTSVETEVVAGKNTAPTLGDLTRKLSYGESLRVDASVFQSLASDADGDSLDAILVATPSSGTLHLSADGAFEFTPAPSSSGTVTFAWQASDGTSVSNIATVTIDIAPPVTPPVTSTGPTSETGDDPPSPDSSVENETTDEPTDATVENGNATDGTNIDTPATETSAQSQSTNHSVIDGVGSDQAANQLFAIFIEDEDAAELRNDSTSVDDRTRTIDSISSNFNAGDSSLSDPLTVTPLESNLWADYAIIASPGQLWDQLDTSQYQLDELIQNEQLIVGSFGAATGGFTVIVLAWLRNGFLLLGFWQQRPLWSQMDPVVLMQGLRSGDDESLEDVIADQRKKLENDPEPAQENSQ